MTSRCCLTRLPFSRDRVELNQQGFTLIEVLIAMTLLSIMVVLLFGSLKICAESWDRGESKMSQVNEVGVVYSFFQRQLTTAIPIWDDFSVADEKTFSFHGDEHSMQFVGEFPASASRGGLQLFSIDLEDEKSGRQIVDTQINVTVKPFLPVLDDKSTSKEQVTLIKNVKELAFSYFGVDDTSELSWQATWLERDSLPQLIKIHIEREDGMYWPDMVVDMKLVGLSDANGLPSEDNGDEETLEEETSEDTDISE
ncbi:MAG: prepilin-type N-terminal cleavage/methylation domain-containing protein [Methylovulum sp.]|nr:prepilin-type N-terminal cleavage/methylation domain-containing protein [Methylovulum sp.]MCF7997424.1 prepilin-type N-terminal cleavage/methylation domain-containing protein [Methylovulum sp.]